MTGADYLQFRQTYRNSLMHSPKGTTWKNHKYIKKENGRYIYPTSPEVNKLKKKNFMKDNISYTYERGKDFLDGILGKKPLRVSNEWTATINGTIISGKKVFYQDRDGNIVNAEYRQDSNIKNKLKKGLDFIERDILRTKPMKISGTIGNKEYLYYMDKHGNVVDENGKPVKTSNYKVRIK